LLKIWVGNRGYGFGSAALAIDGFAVTVVKTVILTKINIIIVVRPGSIKFTPGNNIHICCILAIELSINSNRAVSLALICNIWSIILAYIIMKNKYYCRGTQICAYCMLEAHIAGFR
jgi:hypothetical protein